MLYFESKGDDKMDYTVHNVNIDVAINGKPENVKREIQEMAKLADELKKEYRLCCTLNLKTTINADEDYLQCHRQLHECPDMPCKRSQH